MACHGFQQRRRVESGQGDQGAARGEWAQQADHTAERVEERRDGEYDVVWAEAGRCSGEADTGDHASMVEDHTLGQASGAAREREQGHRRDICVRVDRWSVGRENLAQRRGRGPVAEREHKAFAVARGVRHPCLAR